jgi:general secretion pathway protein M
MSATGEPAAAKGGRSRVFCALALVALVMLPLLLAAAVALPWWQRNAALDEQLAQAQDQLDRFRRLVATLPALRAELEQVESNQDLKAFYFDAPTPALAGAELQRKVQDIVTAAKGRLISTQLLPEQPDEHPPRVRLRIQIQGSTDTLLEVLYGIEGARPFLFIDQVSVRSSARPDEPVRAVRGRPIRRPPVNQAGELTVRLDIFGFALGNKT